MPGAIPLQPPMGLRLAPADRQICPRLDQPPSESLRPGYFDPLTVKAEGDVGCCLATSRIEGTKRSRAPWKNPQGNGARPEGTGNVSLKALENSHASPGVFPGILPPTAPRKVTARARPMDGPHPSRLRSTRSRGLAGGGGTWNHRAWTLSIRAGKLRSSVGPSCPGPTPGIFEEEVGDER